jgi:hypothetical protein
MQIGLVHPLLSVAAPESRAVAAILNALGVKAGVAGAYIYVWDGSGKRQTLLISATCIGLKSLILLGLSCLVGPCGSHSNEARLQVLLIGCWARSR